MYILTLYKQTLTYPVEQEPYPIDRALLALMVFSCYCPSYLSKHNLLFNVLILFLGLPFFGTFSS